MKFFLDTANINEIKEGLALGLVDGVTTNPSLVAKEGVNFHQRIKEICAVVNGSVSAEVTALDFDGMMTEGHILAKLHPNVTVKVPLIPEGIKACKALSSEGIKVNVTLCFSPSQALLAAKAGATYISPFVGRLDDVSTDGIQLIKEIIQIYKNYDFKTQVLAASLRHPMHVVQSAMAGAHVGTMPFSVIKQLFNHPLTDIGLKKFLADWDKVKDQVSK
ncbi:MAG TPA: fructose-6-phosphate aldolase [bacterium]|jgi:transaldolase|nr:fructose-6-phosphate aldolase [bacterium]